MKLKMFLVFILTFLLVPSISFAETYTFTDRTDLTDSGWTYLYKKICNQTAQKGIESAQGCKYYWGQNPTTGQDIITSGFSGNKLAYNGHGCPNDHTQAAANFNPDPATCQSGLINKFELLGFNNIDEVAKLLNSNTCNGSNCFYYVKTVYCNNWRNTESICTALATTEQKAEESQPNNDSVITEDNNELSCDYLFGEESEELKDLIKLIFNLVKILIPLVIIVFSVLDFAKVVFSGSEDDMKKTKQRLVKRLLVAVAIFLVPVLLKLILTISYDIWGILSPDFCGIL